MAKFVNKAGVIIETNDKDKIELFRAKKLKELKIEPQPKQEEVQIVDDYTVKPKKKKVAKKGV